MYIYKKTIDNILYIC